MKIASPKLNTSHLSGNEAATQRCKRAFELKDRGAYEAAAGVMRPLWKRLGDRPNVTGLHDLVAAEVLLTTGVLTGWIGSREAVKDADKTARDLISESIGIYEAVGDVKMVAAARSELAYCYWREGSLDEARILFNEALSKLTAQGNTRANALLGLAVVEWQASRYSVAHKILTDNVSLFRKITNPALKGFYHNTLAMVLRKLVTPEDRPTQLRRVVVEYKEADLQFSLARNHIFRAHVKNNVGGRYRERQG
jgi:tetratricopeptide (TPR) repeat protein